MALTTQGSIVVRRLRRGYTLSMHFKNLTSVPLYQGLDSAGNVSPSWSNPTGNASDSDTAKDAKRPQLQPVVESTSGETVIVTGGKWYYLDTLLTFDSTGKCTTATDDRLDYSTTFKLSTDGTYTLTIIGDLAKKDVNEANDLLTFTCSASTKRSKEQTLTGHVDIVISPISTGSYNGLVGFTSQTIKAGDTGINVTLQLMYGGTICTSFRYCIKAVTKGAPTDDELKDVTDSSSFEIQNAVTADMVQGQTTFLVYFYPAGETDATKYVDCDGFSVLDLNDEYRVSYSYADVTRTEIGDTTADKDTVLLNASVVNQTTGEAVATTSASYTHYVYRGRDENATTETGTGSTSASGTGEESEGNWKLMATLTGTQLTLTNEYTDETVTVTNDDGSTSTKTVLHDLTVIGECEFEI